MKLTEVVTAFYEKAASVTNETKEILMSLGSPQEEACCNPCTLNLYFPESFSLYFLLASSHPPALKSFLITQENHRHDKYIQKFNSEYNMMEASIEDEYGEGDWQD